MRSVTRSFKLQTLLATCLSALVLLSGRIALTDEKAKAPDKIDDLLRKRLALLEEVQRAVRHRLQIERDFSPFELRKADVAVLNARLDLAKSAQDRLTALQEMLKAAEEWKKLVSGLTQANGWDKREELKAEVEVLDAQIALERLKRNPR
jgi:hypothetical protein